MRAYARYRRARAVRVACVHLLASLGACFWLVLLEPRAPGSLVAALRAAFCVVFVVVVTAALAERSWYRTARRLIAREDEDAGSWLHWWP